MRRARPRKCSCGGLGLYWGKNADGEWYLYDCARPGQCSGGSAVGVHYDPIWHGKGGPRVIAAIRALADIAAWRGEAEEECVRRVWRGSGGGVGPSPALDMGAIKKEDRDGKIRLDLLRGRRIITASKGVCR